MTKLQLTIGVNDFTKMISMIALPEGKSVFTHRKIAPTVTKDTLACILQSDLGITSDISYRNLNIKGIKKSETALLPLDCTKIMQYLPLFSGDIIYEYDDETGEISLFNAKSGHNDDKITFASFAPEEWIASNDPTDKSPHMESFPFPLDDNYNPLYKKGELKTNIHINADILVFQNMIKKMGIVKPDSKKYNLSYDATKNSVQALLGDITDRVSDRLKSSSEVIEVSQNGEGVFATGFEQIISNLTGDIRMATITDSPLWIVKQDENYRIGYLLMGMEE